uniref:Fucosyltransferase N-terminal domain-containing protein n=1 Tax=Timema poppense TaxID=170557 RepID=A0A7R9CTB3_TIMPO|nr:unnamed protein product [Timema poppensis]
MDAAEDAVLMAESEIRPLDLKNEIVLHYSPSIQKGLDNLYIKLVDLQSRADTVLSKKMKKMSLRQSFILFLCHKTICIGFVLFCFCSYWLMYSTDLTWLWQLNLQVMRGPNPDFKKDNLKTILLWNDFFNSKHFGFGVGREPFINAGCPVTNCTIVDRSDGYLPLPIEDFNAIWFHMVDSSGVHFPLKRNKHQRYIYFALESPVTMKTLYKTIPIPPDFFNWSMTYRRDSDIHFPYGWVSPISKKSPMPAMPDTKIPIWMEPDFSQLIATVGGVASTFVSMVVCSTVTTSLLSRPVLSGPRMSFWPAVVSFTDVVVLLTPPGSLRKVVVVVRFADIGALVVVVKELVRAEEICLFAVSFTCLFVTGCLARNAIVETGTLGLLGTPLTGAVFGRAVGLLTVLVILFVVVVCLADAATDVLLIGEDNAFVVAALVVVDTNLLEAAGAGALVTIGLTASPFISEGFFSVDVGLVREADKGLGLEEPTVVFDNQAYLLRHLHSVN